MLDKNQNKTESVRFQITTEDKAIITNAAKKEGVSLSEFIRQAIKYYIEEKQNGI